MHIELPISKSIANRLLILRAANGDPLPEVSADMPEDVVLLHDSLLAVMRTEGPLELNLRNCGTAMRFLTAFCASRPLPEITLTGSERMKERPVGQLVDALREAGADISYLGRTGFPPLKTRGRTLRHCKLRLDAPQSSQFVSALLMIGMEVETDCASPYIYITRACMSGGIGDRIEKDWSAAAFWYQWLALHPQAGGLTFPGLHLPSVQGDSRVADIFSQLGITTVSANDGVTISADSDRAKTLTVDFTHVPDLYPAVAMTCHVLEIPLHATGTQSLRLKESDRLAAMQDVFAGHCLSRHDHRISMALLAAGMPADDTQCISKSYPQFVGQLEAANMILHDIQTPAHTA